ncbi:response regulator [Undibacterium sp. Jales W-56]|uniref:response regulator n=1 Tax=Undibacterium sp. Jales W-56 TaxID=2897325 RepID=UPI0021D016BF|nr:response regulator [Undibacterium sp. Jales W-56]MCU6434691.1 response regulator [Undibacterium sp. Jales W-56]
MDSKDISILIVDDNEATREVLRLILSEDYEVVGEAADGIAGLELAVQFKPNIILLDVVMPKISGLEILPRIKEVLPEVKILMVTANKDQETVSEAVKAGIAGFIVKPFNAQRVLDTVAGVAVRIHK